MERLLLTLFLAIAFMANSEKALALSPELVFAKAAPSIVMVFATIDHSKKTVSQGSGVSVGGDKVITNCHVIFDKQGKPSTEIVVLQGSRKSGARFLAGNKDYDTCLLSVPALNMPTVSIANTNNLKVGQRVYAIGAPSGLELTLTDGLLSAIRTVGKSKVIQTSASISPGSSGGGLFDEQGNLVGITSFALKSGTGLNFAFMPEAIFDLLALSLERESLTPRIQDDIAKAMGDRAPPKSSFFNSQEET